MTYANVTVLIPTLNEAKNIGELVRILRLYKGIKIIVADDGSTDGTQEIVRKLKGVKLLDRSKEPVHGLTASILDAARHIETKFFVVIDGDLQHPPEKIKNIVEKLHNGADLVMGIREKVVGEWPFSRRLMSAVATNLARIRLVRWVEDPMSGFFGVRSVLFKLVLAENEKKFEKEGYKVLFDFLKYMPRPISVGKVYYDFGQRHSGTSKIAHKHKISLLKSLIK